METPQEGNDENAIRHYKGTVKQFKDMFDDLAGGKDTNAYNSPVRQGYDIQNTRGDVKSPHWDENHEDEKTQNENHIPTFDNWDGWHNEQSIDFSVSKS
tara:strand:+ start:253 stop:549 length:297 start_codon:yes stop_codon:yes gene_type:complete